MTIEATVDYELCIGSGSCLHLAPAGFERAEDGTALPVIPSGASEEELRRAARSCPAGAITLIETTTPTP
jgi:ferredoxin